MKMESFLPNFPGSSYPCNPGSMSSVVPDFLLGYEIFLHVLQRHGRRLNYSLLDESPRANFKRYCQISISILSNFTRVTKLLGPKLPLNQSGRNDSIFVSYCDNPASYNTVSRQKCTEINLSHTLYHNLLACMNLVLK